MKRKATAATRPFRPDALTWIDYLVMGAIALTFLAIASTTVGHAKANSTLAPAAQAQSQTVGAKTR
ncbi:MAG: hypothetical protein LCH95_07270 [Proteobacteria bacterium]|nr:hypothetical protein [Pseudomonadota bacterium]